MQLLFYKGKYGNFWDKFICLVTSSQYSHVEASFSINSEGYHYCWSSSPRDGGVRQTRILVDDHWDILNIPNISEQIFIQEKGKQYDYVGLIGTVIQVPWFSRQRKWFCSEIVAEALGLKDSWKYSPEDLYQIYK
jgi:hypothetical protein